MAHKRPGMKSRLACQFSGGLNKCGEVRKRMDFAMGSDGFGFRHSRSVSDGWRSSHSFAFLESYGVNKKFVGSDGYLILSYICIKYPILI